MKSVTGHTTDVVTKYQKPTVETNDKIIRAIQGRKPSPAPSDLSIQEEHKKENDQISSNSQVACAPPSDDHSWQQEVSIAFCILS